MVSHWAHKRLQGRTLYHILEVVALQGVVHHPNHSIEGVVHHHPNLSIVAAMGYHILFGVSSQGG